MSAELRDQLIDQIEDARAGEVACRNKADEEAMAGKIAASWDRVVKLSLREQGVPVS